MWVHVLCFVPYAISSLTYVWILTKFAVCLSHMAHTPYEFLSLAPGLGPGLRKSNWAFLLFLYPPNDSGEVLCFPL